LVFDPSFQLSFLATLGLITISPAISKYFKFAPSRFQIRETIIATLATQALVTPLLIHMSGQFSIVSLPANLLVLPFIPFTMLLGFVTGILGFVSGVLSIPFAYASYALLHYELSVAEFLGNLPWASLSVPSFSGLVMTITYVAVFILWVSWRKRQIFSQPPPNSGF